MSYKVFLSNKAGKQYKKLDSHIRDKIKYKVIATVLNFIPN